VFKETDGLTADHKDYLTKHLHALSNHRVERYREFIENKKIVHGKEIEDMKESIRLILPIIFYYIQ